MSRQPIWSKPNFNAVHTFFHRGILLISIMACLVRTTCRSLRRAADGQCRFYSAPVDGSIPAAKQRFVPTHGTYPKGFLLGSAHAGVKPSNTTRDDVAIVVSEKLCKAAGFFTTNAFAAAPVIHSRKVIRKQYRKGYIRGVVINSGCANAVTGKDGLEDAVAMSRAVDEQFRDETAAEWPPAQGGTAEDDALTKGGSLTKGGRRTMERTLVMSTGVIGQRLPITKILSTIPTIKSNLGCSHEHWLAVAKAVMTTDTFPKLVSRQFSLPSDPSTTYTIAGFSKGAGMIHPNMATMLSVICTDAKVCRSALTSAGKEAVSESFNSITIDGDTSTNDSLALFANGAAAPASSPMIVEDQGPDYNAFRKALTSVASDLAKLIVRDGEGATKFVSIHVKGATSGSSRQIGRTIAVSPLVKTALYGKDANWGRILCAIGNYKHSGFVVPDKISVSFGIPGTDGVGRMQLVNKGQPLLPIDEALAKTILDEEDVDIYVDLAVDGGATKPSRSKEITVWTCDFSHEYITINGDYRT